MPERDDAITLERACEVLTDHQHRNGSWKPFSGSAVCRYDDVIVGELTDFEAAAVASAYLAPAAPPQGAADGDAGNPDAAVRAIRQALWRSEYGSEIYDDDPVKLDGCNGGGRSSVTARHLRALLAAAEARPQIGAPSLRSQVLNLADLKDGWYDGDGTAYDAEQLEAVAALLERLAAIGAASVHPSPDGRVYIEWGDGAISNSLEIDPYTTAGRMHLYDLDSGETVVGEMGPESLMEARPQVGEATRRVAEAFADILRWGDPYIAADCAGPARMVRGLPREVVVAFVRECGMEVADGR